MMARRKAKLPQPRQAHYSLEEVAEEFGWRISDLLHYAKKGELELCATMDLYAQLGEKLFEKLCLWVPVWLEHLLPKGVNNFTLEIQADIGHLILNGHSREVYFQSGNFLLALDKENVPLMLDALVPKTNPLQVVTFKLPEHYEITLKVQYVEEANSVCITIPIDHHFNPIEEKYARLKKYFSQATDYPGYYWFQIRQISANSLCITKKEKERFRDRLKGNEEPVSKLKYREATYLNAIGMLFEELQQALSKTGKINNNPTSLIDFLANGYGDLSGLSKRTLEKLIPDARKKLDESKQK